MSIIRAAFPTARTAFAQRAFTTTSVTSKTLTDTVKETADAVNKKVGETLAAGLGKTEELADSAKQTVSEKTPNKLEAHYVAEKAQQSAKSGAQKVNNALDDAAAKANQKKAEVERKL